MRDRSLSPIHQQLMTEAPARQALGMAVAIAWLPGPAGTRRRVAKLSVEEPDAAEPARQDLWGARVSNDPGLPDRGKHGCRPPAHTERVLTAGQRVVTSRVLRSKSFLLDNISLLSPMTVLHF